MLRSNDLLIGWDIVLIDDEPDSAEVANIILLEYGVNVYLAHDGRQGLRLTKHIQPKLVITDLSMPVMNGWEFVIAMKKDEKLSKIPVIALTAHAMKGDQERALSAGFTNYLTKPLTADTFMDNLLKIIQAIPELAKDLHV
ncbi:MAG: response regulator [Chloroflexota bacterium]